MTFWVITPNLENTIQSELIWIGFGLSFLQSEIENPNRNFYIQSELPERPPLEVIRQNIALLQLTEDVTFDRKVWRSRIKVVG